MTRRHIVFHPQFRKEILGSIRTKTLAKLVLLYCWFLLDCEAEPATRVLVRERKKEGHWLTADRVNVAFSLHPEDVIPVIHCSRRTAIDYIQTMKLLWGEDPILGNPLYLKYMTLLNRLESKRAKGKRHDN